MLTKSKLLKLFLFKMLLFILIFRNPAASASLSNNFTYFLDSYLNNELPVQPWTRLTKANLTFLAISNCQEEEVQLVKHLQLQYRPVIRGPLEKKHRDKSYFIRSVTIIVSFANSCTLKDFEGVEESTDSLIEKVSQLGNIRRDDFLLITRKESVLLEEVYANNFISGLKNKIGYALDTGRIFVDPVAFNNATPVTIEEYKIQKELLRPHPLIGNNLRGRHLRIAGCVEALPIHFIRSREPELVEDGTNYRLFLETSIKFNFTFKTYFKEGSGYGTLLKNGTWIGMLANLIYPERNFDCMIAFGHIYEFYDIFDYAGVTSFSTIKFAQALPAKSEIPWHAVFSPFQGIVWIVLAATYVVICLCVLVALYSKSNVSQKEKFLGILHISFFIPYKIFIDQTAQVGGVMRRILLPWLFLTIVIGQAYRSILVSFLTSPSAPPQPQTFAQLAAREDYKVFLYAAGQIEAELFKTTGNPILKKIGKRAKVFGYAEGSSCAKEAVLSDNAVCIGWYPGTANIFINSGLVTRNLQRNSFQWSSDFAYSTTGTVPFRKDSIIVDSMSPVIALTVDTGLYAKWTNDIDHLLKRKMLNEIMNSCTDSDAYKIYKSLEQRIAENFVDPSDTASQALKVKNLLAVFIILIFGLLGSAAVFFWEFTKEERNQVLLVVESAALGFEQSFQSSENSIDKESTVLETPIFGAMSRY